METPNNPKVDALRAAIVEAVNSPDAETIFAEAAEAAAAWLGAGDRDLLLLALLKGAQAAAEESHLDHSDLAEFYEGEAEWDESDLKPEDCREWAESHGAFADVCGTLHDDLGKAHARITQSIRDCDL